MKHIGKRPKIAANLASTTARAFAPRPWIYVDVDNTLLLGSRPNVRLIGWLRARKAEGQTLVLWSARGQEHAQRAARLLGVEELFEAILAKPGEIVDDKGWTWARHVRIADLVQITTEEPDGKEANQ